MPRDSSSRGRPPPQIVKAEALHEVAILAVRLAIAFDKDPRLDRGWANVVFDQHGCRAWTFSAELDTRENIIIVATVDGLLAPLGENAKRLFTRIT